MIAQLFDRHGEESDGNLLTGGQQHILLASGGIGVDFVRLGNQVVGGVALSGNDNHNVVALCEGVGDDSRNVHDTLGVAHGGAAEFLYN